MPVPKKAEPSVKATGSRGDAHARMVAVPRAWLIGLTALVVVPWLVVAAARFWPSATTPAAAPAPPAAGILADEGPWGHLEISPILVSPPIEYVGENWGGRQDKPDEWKFPGVSRDELRAFLITAGFTADQAARVVERAQTDASTRGLAVRPEPELVRSLPPDTRGRLYTQLAKTPLNFDQANAFRFFGTSADAWLAGSPISPETRRVVEPLMYRDGELVSFADIELARAQIKDPAELRRLAKTLLRQSTMLVRLTVRNASEVPQLTEYWGRGGRRTDLRPLLESVAGAAPAQSIDIVHLLPMFARNHLYRYPRLTAADLDRSVLANCLWTALNFFREVPDNQFLDLKVALDTLRQDYFIVESGFQLGDIVAFLDEEGDLFHVAVYLADDLLFSKNGTSPVAPWIIMPLDRVKSFYRSRSSSPRLIYHRLSTL